MSLVLRFNWMLVATIVITIFSFLIFFRRQYFTWVSRYNDIFFSLFGLEADQGSWFRYLVSWILGSCMATVLLTLIVNLADTILLLLGLTGIPADPSIVPLAIGGILISLLLLVVASIPVFEIPLTAPSALGLVTFLHLFGFHYVSGLPSSLNYQLSYLSTFLYFGVIAIGFVGTFLSLYLLLRYYVVTSIFNRYQASNRANEIEELPSN